MASKFTQKFKNTLTVPTMPSDRLKYHRIKKTSLYINCIICASFLSLLLFISVLNPTSTRNIKIQLDDSFLKTAMSAVELPLEKLPISPMRKAILHLTENYKEEKGCKSCNKVQQKLSERAMTANILDKKGPCNFLIFGVGFDSVMWTALNPGRTIFLEDNELWAKKVRKTAPYLEIYNVNYPIRSNEFPQSLNRFVKEKGCNPSGSTVGCFLMLSLPENLLDISWDVIMVDGPSGGGEEDNPPTRQMSIFTAAILARRSEKGAHVLVHDVHREVERVFADKFLCFENLVEALERSARLFSGSRLALRHYYIRSSLSREFCPKN